ncbi:MAG: hypothetical protein ABFS86_16670, partial [Planctomycetota bacterium]
MITSRNLLLAFVLGAIAPSVPAAPSEVVADLEYVVEEVPGYPLVTLPTSETPPAGVTPIAGEKGVRYMKRTLGTETLLLAARFWPEPCWIRVDRDF